MRSLNPDTAVPARARIDHGSHAAIGLALDSRLRGNDEVLADSFRELQPGSTAASNTSRNATHDPASQTVIPAKAGIQRRPSVNLQNGMPACAGMTATVFGFCVLTNLAEGV